MIHAWCAANASNHSAQHHECCYALQYIFNSSSMWACKRTHPCYAMQILLGKLTSLQSLLAVSWTTIARLQQLVAASLLGAASLGQAHSYSGEPVAAMAALPPALGGSHLLHLMLPAFRVPALCGAAAILAVECSHIQPAWAQQL